jgi:tetratricopeptide (TPR) repeat protein
VALEKFELAADLYLKNQRNEDYVKTQNLVLRLLAETSQFDKINVVKEKIQDLLLQATLQPMAKSYYTLALCASFKDQNEVALDYLKKSLELGVKRSDRKDICYAVSGMAIVFHRMGRIPEALKEIENLEVLLQVLDFPEIAISSRITHAQILSSQGLYEKALEILWKAYEVVRIKKTMQMHIYLLCSIGMVYQKSGNRDLARTYLQLASKAIDPKNMARLNSQIQASLLELGSDEENSFDLIFDLENHAVVERKMGRVDFKNQFILLDLLKLFVSNQGQVYSKEFLVENVWKQSYDPSVHDNKVYVTIKRLRKLIEPDFDRPKYIFRAKNGYFINKSARIFIEAGPSGGNA